MTFRAAGVVPPPPSPGVEEAHAVGVAEVLVPVLSVPMKLPSMRLPTVSPVSRSLGKAVDREAPDHATSGDVRDQEPVPAVHVRPLSSILSTASLPTALVLGEEPGWV